ncbi:MAG: type II CRISPR RNA-guided endonuclease Cas9 [Sporomusaceae bacterium]|jgi:CRISPR-associated endonuclease Csn1|nr:type II CRISPR RNA-guided endonuclease Cas9 [Sporomusaceae bacterium]
MDYTLGLDLGIASVGWCVLDRDREKIENLGVRIFTKAEDSKTGASLALPRRLARSARRRIRRRAHRLERIKKLLVREGLLSKVEIFQLEQKPLAGPYQLRAAGLDRLLQNEEWAKVLLHIAKRRGFKSNRKSEASEKETGKMLAGIKATAEILHAKNYRTAGEMFYKDEKFSYPNPKRNKGGSYAHTIERSTLEAEIAALFAAQRQFANQFAGADFEKEFCAIFASQRPFASKDAIEKMVGKCTFEEKELRAPKNSYTAERFTLLSKINNFKLLYLGIKTDLTSEQREIIEKLAYKNKEVTYKQIRKALNFSDNADYKFAAVKYGNTAKNSEGKDPETMVFIKLTGFQEIKKAVTTALGESAWYSLGDNPDILDDMAYGLTFFKTDQDISEYLTNKGISAEYINAVLPLSFSKVMHLSIKAMKKINIYLAEGDIYSKACEKAGYLHYDPGADNRKKAERLPVIEKEELRNPVVLRAVTQARKVINAIIAKYGSPSAIHIEVARDLSKPFEERKKIENEQKNYQKLKGILREKFKEIFGREPKSEELLKFRLWDEQQGFCPYTQNYLDPEKSIKEPGYAEIDHILPYSRSFDDSMANKVLVTGSENRNKGNRTPQEYLPEKRWHLFQEWVGSHIKSYSKRQKLLTVDFAAKEEEMRSRNLNDTRYICRYVAQFLKNNLIFANENIKQPVLMMNGALTAFLRAKWGLIKARENGDLHHALDAAVIAAASEAMTRRIARFSKARELYHKKYCDKFIDLETGEIVDTQYKNIDSKNFPQPWDNFREELIARLAENPAAELMKLDLDTYKDANISDIKKVFVSRAPRRKLTGQAHEETIRSAKYLAEGRKVAKIPLLKINLENLEKMWGKERDFRLYEALKSQLNKHDNDPKKAFANPFYKPTEAGRTAPLVRSIKICVAGTSGVAINEGIADNGQMVKVMVYKKDKKYFLIPIYTADVIKNQLPNKAIAASKPESEWTVIDETYDFLFEIFKNDLVYIKTKKEKIFGYYVGCHSGTGALTVESHDRKNTYEGIGVKTCLLFEKWQVDVLGNYGKIEARQR